jgi:hypothetical protein
MPNVALSPWFALDSALEGDGFELSVPRRELTFSRDYPVRSMAGYRLLAENHAR